MKHVVKKEKLLSFSAILSILVVLIHSQNTGLFCIRPDGSLLDKIVYWLQELISGDLARIGVPAFFMVSGLLFYRDFDFSKYPTKMKSRFFSLVIPYLLWNLFRFVLFYVLGKISPEGSSFHQTRVVFTIPNFLEGLFFYKYNLGYWFMYQLILYTLLCPLIYLLLKKKPIAVFALIALFLLFCTDALGEISIHLFRKKFIQIDGLFYYMLGAFFGMHYFDAVNKNNALTHRLSVLGILAGQLCFVLFQVTDILFFHITFCTLSAISFWYLFDIIGKKTLPMAITTITFFIYSAHGTVLELFQHVNYKLFPHHAATALIEYLLLPAITLMILVVAAKVFKRFSPRLWKFVNGGR